MATRAHTEERAAAEDGVRRDHRSAWLVWIVGLPTTALLVGLLHIYGLGPFRSLQEELEKEEALEREASQLEQENAVLNEEIGTLEPGGFGIEKRAREKLGFSEIGEIIIHIPDKR